MAQVSCINWRTTAQCIGVLNMQFQILFSLLPLLATLVRTRRVIRAAPGIKTTGEYMVVLAPDTSHERFEAVAKKIQSESMNSEMHKMESPFAKIIVTKLSVDEAHEVSLVKIMYIYIHNLYMCVSCFVDKRS